MVFKSGAITKQEGEYLVIRIPTLASIEVKGEYCVVCFTVKKIVVWCSYTFGVQCISEKIGQDDLPWSLKTMRYIKLFG